MSRLDIVKASTEALANEWVFHSMRPRSSQEVEER